MENKVSALLIPALFVAGAAHAAEICDKDGNGLDLYSKVDGLHYFSDNSTKDDGQSYARLGFKGEIQVNDQLTGYGQWEYNIQAGSTKSLKNQSQTRLAFTGLKFVDYGSFDYGRNYGIMYGIGGWADMLPEFDGDSYTNADGFMTGRINDVAAYRSTDFFGLVNGLNSAMQYQGDNEGASNGREGTNNGRGIRHENGDGWGLSITYDLGMGSNAGTAYTSSDRTNDQVNHTAAGGGKVDVWTAGLEYGVNNIYLAIMYLETRNMTPFGDSDYAVANETQNFEVTTQYQFDLGLCPAISFPMPKSHDLHATGGAGSPAGVDDKDPVKYAGAGTTYYFNRNVSTYVNYKINPLNEDDSFCAASGISIDDIVALGLVYQS